MIETLDTVETPATLPTLRRRPPYYTQRAAAFYSADSRTLALETNRVITLTLDGDLASDLLAFVERLPASERPRMVFICGGDSSATTPPEDWWLEPLVHGWTLRQWHAAADRRTCVYERAGVSVDLRMAAAWFGGDGAALDPVNCLTAWRRLRGQVRGAFGNGAALMTTPAQTGLQLLEAALPGRAAVATLPTELRDLLHEQATQGRRELFSPYTWTLDSLYELDARWMYAACLSHLPVGPVVCDAQDEFAGAVPGFYLVRAQVPYRWDHIGLLPDRDSLHGPGPVSYPRRPRKQFWSWATGAEVALARDNGWRLVIHQRMLWPETHRLPDVARGWGEHLRTLRNLAQYSPLTGSTLVSGALRKLLIDTVGRWNSRDRVEYGFSPTIDSMPRGAIPHIGAGGVIQWERYVELPPALLRYAHPEWAMMVWGRARRRLALKAMTLPLHSLVALRTDGIWTTANPGDLAYQDESTQPGAWRVKSALTERCAWPETEAQLIELMRQARGHDGEE